MSLILEALKKSEQERRRERGPDLQSIHRAPLGPVPASRRNLWPPLLALLLLLNGAALAWWLLRGVGEPAAVAVTTPVAQPAASSAGVAPPIAAAEAQQAVEVAPQAAPPSKQQELVDPEFTEVAPLQPLPTTAPVQQLWELPEPVRRGLPPMTYSFHVYSSDPQRRTIIINNRTLREGQQVSDGVLLEEITPDGVILATGGYRVQIPVLGEW
jgi:general secretion pathway protein B